MGLLGVCRGIGLESGFGFRIWGRSPATSFGQTGKLDWYIFVHLYFRRKWKFTFMTTLSQKSWSWGTGWMSKQMKIRPTEMDTKMKSESDTNSKWKLSLRLWRPFRRSHDREGRDGSGAGQCTAGSGGPPPPHARRFLAEIWRKYELVTKYWYFFIVLKKLENCTKWPKN